MRSSCSHIRRSTRKTSAKKCPCCSNNIPKRKQQRRKQKKVQNQRMPRSLARALNPVWTERRTRIRHTYGALELLISKKCRMMAQCVEELRELLRRQIYSRLVFRGSRYITLKQWVRNNFYYLLKLTIELLGAQSNVRESDPALCERRRPQMDLHTTQRGPSALEYFYCAWFID